MDSHIPHHADNSIPWAELWFQGLGSTIVGSLLGAGALIAVWRLTKSSDREKARDERTAQSVASVLEACGSLPSGGYSSRFELKSSIVHAADSLARALILFGARETADHERASLWAFAWAERLSSLGDQASRIPEKSDKLAGVFDEIGEEAAQVVAQLVDWVKAKHKTDMELPPDSEQPSAQEGPPAW